MESKTKNKPEVKEVSEMDGKKKSVMKIRVAASDTEFQGNISNPRYFEWFSKARIEYYRDRGVLSIDHDGVPLIDGKRLAAVLVSTSCRFHSTGRFDDLLDLITTVSHVGKHSITFHHELLNPNHKNVLVADAEATHVFLDPATGEKVEIPRALKQMEEVMDATK